MSQAEHEAVAIASVVEATHGMVESEELPTSAFDFDGEFQTKIAAHVLRDSRFMRRVGDLIKPEYFESANEAIAVGLALEHYKKYDSVPCGHAVWGEIIKDARSRNLIRKEMMNDFVATMKALLKYSISDGEYVSDMVGNFARHQAINRASFKMLELLDKGRVDEAQQLMQKAFSVGAQDDFVCADYWNDIERRTEYRRAKAAGDIKPQGIPSGIKKFDNLLYHKGWGRKELSVLMGGAKKGKSTGLGEFAMRACLQGYNVLYVTLEVSKEIIMDRLDANISDTELNSLEDHLNDIDSQVSTKAAGKRGEFHVVEAPSGSLTPSGLKRIIDRYRSVGIVFDMICPDYADIMAPDYRTSDPIENSKQIWLGLRAIAFEENCAMLTATQTNRDGFKSSVAKAEHVAEDFNKVRIADLIITINRDDDETTRKEARLFFAANRNGAGEFAITIKQDLGKAQFLKSVGGIVV